MKTLIAAFFLLLSGTLTATHLVGGDFYVEWKGGDNYEVTLKVLRDCQNGNPNAYFDIPVYVGLFDKTTNAKKQTFSMNFISDDTLKFTGANCPNIITGCTHIGTYKTTISLPVATYGNTSGYYLSWQRCCRNGVINNIVNPGSASMTIYAEIPSPKVLKNSTPHYTNNPVTLLCVNNLFKYNMNFVDEDGDALQYSFVTPLNGNLSSNMPSSNVPTSGPYPTVVWATGYGVNNVITGILPLTINPTTGEISCNPVSPGIYVASIRVEEYRFGVKIGEVRLELQFTVTNCPNNPPASSLISIDNQILPSDTVTVKVPNKLCLKIRAIDTEDSVFMHINTSMKDSPFVNLPVFDTLMTGSLFADDLFCFQSACEHERLKVPFRVDINTNDNGCPIARSVSSSFWVKVIPRDVVRPTQLLCMTLKNNQEIYLYWGDTTDPANPDFQSYIIFKGIDKKNFVPVDTIYDKFHRFYHDTLTLNYSKINYSYYMVGVNKCGRFGVTSDTMTTLEQLKLLPAQQSFRYATVVDNKEIHLEWPSVPKKQFAQYFLYKKKRGEKYYKQIAALTHYSDTTFTDADVSVSDTSYCYHLVMKDTCDNIGPQGFEACTMVLKGLALDFKNSLNWSNYVGWYGGVKQYGLWRADPADSFTSIYQTDTVLKTIDNDLNMKEGLFYYTVYATEAQSAGPIFYNAQSQSNTIQLYQKPIMWVPTAVTANGDGLNDKFAWVPVFVKDFEIQIYDRWGQQVYQSKDKLTPWDATIGGSPAPTDVYFYRLFFDGYDGSAKVQSGSFTLLR